MLVGKSALTRVSHCRAAHASKHERQDRTISHEQSRMFIENRAGEPPENKMQAHSLECKQKEGTHFFPRVLAAFKATFVLRERRRKFQEALFQTLAVQRLALHLREK